MTGGYLCSQRLACGDDVRVPGRQIPRARRVHLRPLHPRHPQPAAPGVLHFQDHLQIYNGRGSSSKMQIALTASGLSFELGTGPCSYVPACIDVSHLGLLRVCLLRQLSALQQILYLCSACKSDAWICRECLRRERLGRWACRATGMARWSGSTPRTSGRAATKRRDAASTQ